MEGTEDEATATATTKNNKNERKACNQIKEFLSGLKRIREQKVNKDSI